MRPRVLHVVIAGEVGGAERMLCDLASRPEESDAEHAIALMTPSEDLRDTFRRAGLTVFDRGRVRENAVAFLWRSLGPKDVHWLVEVLDQSRADMVQLHTFGSQVTGTRAALKKKLPVIRTEHSTRVYDDPTCWPFSRWSLARASRVVFISEHLRLVAEAKAGALLRGARVIRNGVDVARFSADGTSAAAPFTFVMVARLDARKGIDRAIRALEGVPEARLSIVGDGAERGALEALVRERGLEGRVRFHGKLDDPRPIMAQAHAAVCSSRSEGLGIANLEAMAMGLPVVAFPVGGVPEIVRDGETGWVTREETEQALSASMRDAVSAPERTRALGRAARAFVVERCSIDAMCRAYGSLYREVLSPGA
jgi:glycosyltransferase involved in cell wall biosynthesis